jgi:hypothetical protein
VGAAGLSHRLSSPERVPHPCREPLHFIVTTVTVVTLPMSRGFLRDGPLLGSAIYRHREKPFAMQFFEWCDDCDGRDGGFVGLFWPEYRDAADCYPSRHTRGDLYSRD